METDRYLVSVIINTHNDAKYLNKSIKSVLDQNYKNLELIIWDNASTDNTREIVNNFKDKRLQYFYSENFDSLYSARNKALKISNGNYITFLDSDDIFTQNSLRSRIETLNKSNFLACYSNLFISRNFKKKKIFYNKKQKSGNIFSNALIDYKFCFLSFMFKKEIFEKFYFDPNFNVIGDMDFVLRVAKKINFAYCDDPVGIYNIHSNNFSNSNENLHAKELRDWLNKYYFELLDNKKKLKRPIILKYMVLKGLSNIKNNSYLDVIKYFIKLKKNVISYLILKKYLNFLLLKYFDE